MYANYHTHTARCGHACGTDREYVQHSVDGGIKILGISDHAPYLFKGGFESGFRVKIAEAPGYFESFRALREEFSDRLDEMYIGFEMEYYPAYFDDTLKYIKSLGCEYLLLGQHALFNEYPGGIMSGTGTADVQFLEEYVRTVCAGMERGVYTYLCHPELFRFTGPEDVFLEKLRPVCITARETGTPLEINFLGIRDHRAYPREAFWKMVSEEHNDVILGCDAHNPVDTVDEYSLGVAMEWVKKYNLNLLEKLTPRKL